MSTQDLPKFQSEYRYDGEAAASRWLDSIYLEFESAGFENPPPAHLLRIINILCIDKAANWIDSTPNIREIIKNRLTATVEDIAYVRMAFEERFPGNISDQSELPVQLEVENLRQAPEESLSAYYARTTRLLIRTYGRDRPRDTQKGQALTGPEEFTLATIITAYTRGLSDDVLRKEVAAKGGVCSKALWKCQEIVLETQQTIVSMKQYEEQEAQSQELERLRDLVLSDYGQPASVILAAKAGTRQSQSQAYGIPEKHQAAGYGMRPTPMTHQNMNYVPAIPQQKQIQYPQQTKQFQQPRNGGNPRGRGGFQNSSSWRENSSPQKDTNPHPPRSTSTNPYVNMTKAYDRSIRLCVGCGETGHFRPNCSKIPLELWEQAYLKQLVFGGPGVSAHLLMLENERAYYDQAQDNQNQEAGYALDDQSAASSALLNPTWAPSLKEYCGQRLTDSPSKNQKSKKKKAENEKLEMVAEIEDDEESLSIEAFLADPARKRLRGEEGRVDIQDLLNSESSEKPRKIRKSISKLEKNGKKAVSALREIVGREGLGPMNYRALAEKIEVPLNLLEFFQASPDAAKEFRKMSQRVNTRAKKREIKGMKKKERVVVDSALVKLGLIKNKFDELPKQSDFDIEPKSLFPKINPENKAFHFTAMLRGRHDESSHWKRVTLSPGISQADQGSELNIISQGLVKAMAFPRFTLTGKKDGSGLFVSTADGGATELKEFTCFDMGVSGIWRRIYAFIRPQDTKGSGEFHLLLGLPWLYEVHALISIRDSVIYIGDKETDGRIVTLNSPEFVPSSPHNLVLQPKKLVHGNEERIKNFNAETEEDSEADDESSDTTDDEEDLKPNLVTSSYFLKIDESDSWRPGTLDASWDEKERPSCLLRSQDEKREKSAIRASSFGLEHNQADHPSIYDESYGMGKIIEKFPTNRRPERRKIEEVDEETLEEWFSTTEAKLGEGVPSRAARIR
ncbi:hypothetical protein EPUL_006181, partial [Erysiphe pulchra]